MTAFELVVAWNLRAPGADTSSWRLAKQEQWEIYWLIMR